MRKFEERINELTSIAIEELKQINIFPSENIREIKENCRAKKRLGCCKKEKVGLREFFIIEISTVLEQEDDQTVKEIIIHELLHTCKGCFNHGREWKAKAEVVNSKYGYKIKTYADPKQLDIALEIESKPRYEVKCISCGTIGYRKKKCRLVKNPHLYRCSKCGGSLVIVEI